MLAGRRRRYSAGRGIRLAVYVAHIEAVATAATLELIASAS